VPSNVITVPTVPETGLTVKPASTVNVVMALFSCPESSVPVKLWGPPAVVGIVYVQLKLPRVLSGTKQICTEPDFQLSVTHVQAYPDPPAKPVPANVTVVPTVPVAGMAINWGMTVKVAVAEWELESLPVKVCPPAELAGRISAQLKLPSAFVVVEQAVPWLQLTMTPEFAAKPVPLNVRGVPTNPATGLTVRTGETRGETLYELRSGTGDPTMTGVRVNVSADLLNSPAKLS
jgi:hypothetical protein